MDVHPPQGLSQAAPVLCFEPCLTRPYVISAARTQAAGYIRIAIHVPTLSYKDRTSKQEQVKALFRNRNSG